jgi:hypothetical protein
MHACSCAASTALQIHRYHSPRSNTFEGFCCIFLLLSLFPHRGHESLSVVSVVCCQVEFSATNWSLVQRSPTDCGASLCDLEISWMRRSWPTGGILRQKQTNKPMSASTYSVYKQINLFVIYFKDYGFFSPFISVVFYSRRFVFNICLRL